MRFFDARTAFAAMLTVLCLIAIPAPAADNTSDRLERKIGVMEKVIDEVLVQSPNIYVTSLTSTRGLVLDGYGALFTLDGSLGGGLLGAGDESGLMGNFFVPHAPRKGDRASEADEDMIMSEALLDREALADWKANQQQKSEENLAGLKKELRDALLDYGATLTELADDSWVTVVAFLDGDSPFGSGDERRLLLKVKMTDLRAHISGRLSRDAAEKKIVIEVK